VENILKVVKENGFTSYNTDVDIAWNVHVIEN
jgi:hypothetical protein